MLQRSHSKPIITLPGSPSPQGAASLPDTGLLHTRPTWEAEAGSPPLKRLVPFLASIEMRQEQAGPAAGSAEEQPLDARATATEGQRDTQAGAGEGRPPRRRAREAPAGLHREQEPGSGRGPKTPDTQAPIPGGTTCGPGARATRNRGSGPAASPRQPPDQACPPTVGLGVRPKLVLGGSGECVCARA